MIHHGSNIRRPRDIRPQRHIYLPHSSWTAREPSTKSDRAIAPEDFWTRLGL
ncbi:hypothetical protein [Sphingobium sp. CCH11-B1]|jgi:hypothetical protein|uniref:hypothetical protein n=1 Tax=Sphingobium sp. CCH11-B1 TaxID=1768781 RepID=UPI000B2BFB16|nr:hypothetical protein [Sphingobium sp. CCH11-B1]MEA3387747.1 hypothetical protein [Pseudomonadota bacterium]